MKKQIQHLLVLIIALICALPASAYFCVVDGICYGYDGSIVFVTSCNTKYTGSIRIPESITYKGVTYPVSSIGYKAFYQCSGLTEVTIPNSVTSIDDYAFYECSGLTEVTIPNSVTTIGHVAFCGCNKLTSVVIPNSVTSIGNDVFSYCSSLREVVISNSITSISQNAFYKCSGLTEVTIPNSVTSIGNSAFSDCSALKEVTIPNSVTSIGDNAFSYCSALTEVTIPNSVTSIGRQAFSYCSALTEVTIPNSVTSIGGYAFYNSNYLKAITVNNSNPANISLESGAFYNAPTSTCTLFVPKGSKELYAVADQWKAFMNIVEFESEPICIIDGEIYDADDNMLDVNVNYTRNFTNTEWQPLYVPFNMSYDEWSTYADVAEVHNVRGYDNDGVIDETVIEFNKLSSGEIVPNIPYVIKAKNEGEVTFECTGKTLLAAPAEEGTVECSSTKMTYSLHGIYQPKDDMFSTGAYHLSDGVFNKAESNEDVLSPNRFYLMVTPKTGGYNPTSAPRMIRMMVNGDDTTTSIEGIEVDTQNDNIFYDLMGRKVVNPTQGIYIQNGRKVFVK